MNREEEPRFTGWIDTVLWFTRWKKKEKKGLQVDKRRRNKVYRLKREGVTKVYKMKRERELRFTGWIEKENKGLQDE